MIGPVIAAALIQYTALTAPVWVPTQADEPQTQDRWAPHYADRVPAKPRTITYAPHPTAVAWPPFVPDVTIQPLTWQPTYPDRCPPPRRTSFFAFSSEVNPPFQPPPFFDPGGQIIATGAIRQLLQYQSLSGPVLLDTVQPAPDQAASFGHAAERVAPRVGLHASRQQAWAFDVQWGAPAAPTVPDLLPQQFQHPLRRPVSRAVYEKAQPIFGVIVSVPVMSWTGLYLDPPMRRRVRYQPEPKPFPLDYDTTINPASPVLAWRPEYPDRVVRAIARHAAHAAEGTEPVFIPDVTTGAIPVLSWSGCYPDRVPAARRLRTGAQPAWFSDKFTAPTPIVVPDLAAPVYPDFARGRRPNTHHPAYLAPLLVPDVTQPVGGMEWLAIYPDRIDRGELPTYAKLSWTGVVFITEFIPAPVIGDIEGRGSFVITLTGPGSFVSTLSGRGSL